MASSIRNFYIVDSNERFLKEFSLSQTQRSYTFTDNFNSALILSEPAAFGAETLLVYTFGEKCRAVENKRTYVLRAEAGGFVERFIWETAKLTNDINEAERWTFSRAEEISRKSNGTLHVYAIGPQRVDIL